MGFFFAQEEKKSLYTENFADILDKEGRDASYSRYFSNQEHAGDQRLLWLDLMTYLPDDILVKIDRMSMAASLEVRAPFLDHAVVEFMAGVHRRDKFTLGQSKRLLRLVAERYLPASILKRPKQGFAIPLGRWLQHELKDWMVDILTAQQCRQRGYFRPETVTAMMATHAAGQRDLSQQLWAMIVLELWFKHVHRP